MGIDQPQLEAALGAIVEPELGLELGGTGMLREVRARRRRARIELALPVAAWPGSDELADEVHRVAMAVPGVEEIEFDLTVMRDDERAAPRGHFVRVEREEVRARLGVARVELRVQARDERERLFQFLFGADMCRNGRRQTTSSGR